jgi:hypothetical protein
MLYCGQYGSWRRRRAIIVHGKNSAADTHTTSFLFRRHGIFRCTRWPEGVAISRLPALLHLGRLTWRNRSVYQARKTFGGTACRDRRAYQASSERQGYCAMKTFLDLVLAGDARQDDIDDFVDQWHDGDASCSLAEFLGMSDDEYALWVEKPATLSLILQAHAEGMRLEKMSPTG